MEKSLRNKKILIVGGSGFIGSALRDYMHENTIILLKGRKLIEMEKDELIELLKNTDVVINLSGYPISKRWTNKNKQLILSSRVLTTRKLVEALNLIHQKIHFINASAIGIYSNRRIHEESSKDYANHFLSYVVQQWEAELQKLDSHISYSIVRLGIVLGNSGGVYKIFKKLVKWNMGAYFGKGKQKLSFISLNDLTSIFVFIINQKIFGIVNAVAPENTDYYTLMHLMKDKYHAKILWQIPEFIIKMFFGQASLLFLESQEAKPQVLLKNNYNFIAPNIKECIDNIRES